jgi:hypothetical protein
LPTRGGQPPHFRTGAPPNARGFGGVGLFASLFAFKTTKLKVDEQNPPP